MKTAREKEVGPLRSVLLAQPTFTAVLKAGRISSINQTNDNRRSPFVLAQFMGRREL